MPFSELGTTQRAPASDAAAALAAVRSYRRVPPPELPRAPRRKLGTLPSRPCGRGCLPDANIPPLAAPPLPGVPPDWCEGVTRLATLPAPDRIPPPRWAVLASTAGRLLRDHGAELHAAGWTALDLFGLHPTSPMTHPAGWGLAWLLGEQGEVLDVAPNAVGMRQGPGGARLAFYMKDAPARASIRPAWNLSGVPE